MISIQKIGEEIRVEMARQNVRDTDVAEKSGVHRTTVSAIKQGTIENPQIKTLEQVVEALGLELTLEIRRPNETAAV
jgi:transcriptional regulator with XRE-family HTH domain